MANVQTDVKGNILTVKIDLSKDQGMSKSGKSRIIGTTGGNIALADGVKLGVNCYRLVE